MTESGYQVMQDNQRQRVKHNVLLEALDQDWGKTDEGINRFTARYLNAIRLNEKEVKKISKKRLDNFDGDINESKCTECKIREECFSVFGGVDFGGTTVGLFPF